ncbi:MAG: alpha/beta hydrolase [Rubritepida sp.]|nr:alpha/beta hydrolase [Rubritepida sp.]
MTHPWNGLTPEEHERHYNPQHAVPDFRASQLRRDPLNAAAASLAVVRDIAYGPDPLDTLDLYPAAVPGAAVHIFFHGGYWRAQDKANFAFIAQALVRRGVTAVIANYPLCPRVTLDEVVASARACVAWVMRHAAEHGGDPHRITLSGHSAGAHLVAAILAADWEGQKGTITGALMTSGIYDPTPAMLTSVNADLRLTPELARRHDYERLPPRVRCPVWVMAGGLEPWLWVEQSLRYAQHLRRHGIDSGLVVAPGLHHFDIIDQYADEGSLLTGCLSRLA